MILFGAAIGLHILQTLSWSFYQTGILNHTVVVEITAIAVSLVIGYFAWKIYKRLPQSDLPQKEKKNGEKRMKKFEKMY